MMGTQSDLIQAVGGAISNQNQILAIISNLYLLGSALPQPFCTHPPKICSAFAGFTKSEEVGATVNVFQQTSVARWRRRTGEWDRETDQFGFTYASEKRGHETELLKHIQM